MIVFLTRLIAAFTVLSASILSGASSAGARDNQTKNWREVKCERYKQGWATALTRMGTRGLGKEFLDSPEAFLASGCTAVGRVCPRSSEELELANIMVIVAMNAGTASTFPPFACNK